ncbi:ABC transporter permease subunit [Candidatus Aerophobetes bacterium]|nr:ABC transporter permease subunit [Candidatus Aerophobetes bacterium]
MNIKERVSHQINAVRVITKRELKSTFIYGIGVYLAIFISLLISSFILKNYLDGIKDKGMLMMTDPLNYPLYITALISSFYLALMSSLSISREKDHRTIEVLFYGPIDHASFVIAKYINDILVYLIMTLFFLAYFFLISFLTNFTFSFSFVKLIILSIFLASCMISFGLFLSSLTTRIRSSIILFLSITLGFFAIQMLYGILSNTKPELLSTPFLYLRNIIEVFYRWCIQWISPFSYFDRGLKAVSLGIYKEYGISIGSSLLYSALMIIFSILILKKKGIVK